MIGKRLLTCQAPFGTDNRESRGPGELRNSLPHGLRHGISCQKQQREEHGAHDCVDQGSDVAQLSDLSLDVLPLILRQRFVR